MRVKGKLSLTSRMVLRFDLDQPQKIENLDEPVVFVLYEVLSMALLQFGKDNVIKALQGELVVDKIELPEKIDSYLLEGEKTLVGYV